MSVLAATVQCHTMDNKANVNRLLSVVRNEDIAVAEMFCLPPVHDIAFKARQEILARFVAGRVVQLNAEDVSVIKNDQTPAVSRFKRASAIAPWQPDNPVQKIVFTHFVVPETLRRCMERQRWH